MDKKTVQRVVNLNEKVQVVKMLLERLEPLLFGSSGKSVDIVLSNDESYRPIVDKFCSELRCILDDYEREIEKI